MFIYIFFIVVVVHHIYKHLAFYERFFAWMGPRDDGGRHHATTEIFEKQNKKTKNHLIEGEKKNQKRISHDNG